MLMRCLIWRPVLNRPCPVVGRLMRSNDPLSAALSSSPKAMSPAQPRFLGSRAIHCATASRSTRLFEDLTPEERRDLAARPEVLEGRRWPPARPCLLPAFETRPIEIGCLPISIPL